MKKLLTVILLILFALPSYASDLPPCPKDQTQTYHNCFGANTWASGNKYVGEYKDNQAHGNGTGTYVNGEKYVGEFKNGKRNGKGTNTWLDGHKYVGEWKDNKTNGKGAQTNSDGSKYVGEWKNNKYHGNGTYTFADGTVLSGIWADNKYLYKSVESARSECAKEAGKAGTEYAAKQIEKTCLAEKQLEPES